VTLKKNIDAINYIFGATRFIT